MTLSSLTCLWDYDTLLQERSRFPDALELITGWLNGGKDPEAEFAGKYYETPHVADSWDEWAAARKAKRTRSIAVWAGGSLLIVRIVYSMIRGTITGGPPEPWQMFVENEQVYLPASGTATARIRTGVDS